MGLFICRCLLSISPYLGVSPLTDIEGDSKLGKELANVKGFWEIDNPPWFTGGATSTGFHTRGGGACDSSSRRRL